MLGIIGGTGIYSVGKFKEKPVEVSTPYGFAQLYMGEISGTKCAFVPRHGKDHRHPPHKVNYKANVWALEKVGVEGVIATYAVGIISKYRPGDLVVADDFMGLNILATFYDDFAGGMKHLDFSEPYSKRMQQKLFSAAKNAGAEVKKGGIVATTFGPRFETRAEVNALKKMGANLVSMTNAYEATLLHELEIPMVGLCIGTNYACGISKKPLSHSEVISMVAKKEREVNMIVAEFAKLV